MQEFEQEPFDSFLYSASRSKRFYFCPVGYQLYYGVARNGADAAAATPQERAAYCAKFRTTPQALAKQILRRHVRSRYHDGRKYPGLAQLSKSLQSQLERMVSEMERHSYRDDPKGYVVFADFVLGRRSLDELFNECSSQLQLLTDRFANSDLAACLERLPYLNMISLPEIFCIAAFGTIFYLPEWLTFRMPHTNQIQSCIFNTFDEQTQHIERTIHLLRYALTQHLQVSPAQLATGFYEPESGKLYEYQEKQSFAAAIHAMQTESAMFQNMLAPLFHAPWVPEPTRANLEHCGVCFFRDCCPICTHQPRS